MVPPIGIGVTPFQTDDEATVRLAVRAEELGYGRFAAAERLASEVTPMAGYDQAPEAIRLWLDAGADTVDVVLPLGAA